MRAQEKRFPKGLRYNTAYDTTPFIRESVNEVFNSAVRRRRHPGRHRHLAVLARPGSQLLLLPVIDVAVSLVGTFAVMSLLGFSLNNLTLFGLVLAIGIVVVMDDAIVVLENICRLAGQGPRRCVCTKPPSRP